jgi:hypothetical protein
LEKDIQRKEVADRLVVYTTTKAGQIIVTHSRPAETGLEHDSGCPQISILKYST